MVAHKKYYGQLGETNKQKSDKQNTSFVLTRNIIFELQISEEPQDGNKGLLFSITLWCHHVVVYIFLQ